MVTSGLSCPITRLDFSITQLCHGLGPTVENCKLVQSPCKASCWIVAHISPGSVRQDTRRCRWMIFASHKRQATLLCVKCRTSPSITRTTVHFSNRRLPEQLRPPKARTFGAGSKSTYSIKRFLMGRSSPRRLMLHTLLQSRESGPRNLARQLPFRLPEFSLPIISQHRTQEAWQRSSSSSLEQAR